MTREPTSSPASRARRAVELDPRAAARLAAPAPATLLARPIDDRRQLPVPYVNVHTRDGREVTDFSSINSDRALHAGKARLCGLCGTPLGYWIAFIGGPNTIRFRAFSDPPAHPACALAALGLCPHMALAHARRARRPHADTWVPVGFVDTKPVERCLAITRDYQVGINRGSGMFRAAPFRSVHRWHYNAQGTLVSTAGSRPIPEAALAVPTDTATSTGGRALRLTESRKESRKRQTT